MIIKSIIVEKESDVPKATYCCEKKLLVEALPNKDNCQELGIICSFFDEEKKVKPFDIHLYRCPFCPVINVAKHKML